MFELRPSGGEGLLHAAAGFALVALFSLTFSVAGGRADPPPTPPDAPPAFADVPSVSSAPMGGQLVSVAVPRLVGTAPITTSCQWQQGGNGSESDSWTDIAGGAVCSGFTVPSSLSGYWLRARVTATNSAGSAVAYSWPLRVGGVIVYQAYPSDNVLWVMNGDGTNKHRLFAAFVAWNMSMPEVSPIGDEIAFVSNKDPAVGNGAKGDTGIWAIGADGSGDPRLIADNAGDDITPQWSPDGSKLLYVNASDHGLYVVDADGRNNTKLYTFLDTKLTSSGFANAPTFTPDGGSIVFFDEHGGASEGYLKQYAVYDSSPAYQYASRQVAPGTVCSTDRLDWGFSYSFGASVDCEQQLELYEISATSGALSPLTNNEPLDATSWSAFCNQKGYGYCRDYTRPRFSPSNPDLLVFANGACNGTSIATIGGTSFSNLSLAPSFFGSCARILNHAWAPDGNQIAFYNGVYLNPELDVTPVSGFASTKLADMRDGFDWGIAPELAPPVPIGQTCGFSDVALDGSNREGENVDARWGHYSRGELDLQLPGIDEPFKFARSYCSALSSAGDLGVGWRHNWESALTVQVNQDVSVTAPSGQQLYFTKLPSGAYKAAAGGQGVTLTKLANTYELELDGKRTYVYDLNGRLQSLRTRNGKTITLGYDGNGRLTSITDTANRTITITRDAGNPARIASVRLPDGRQVSFTYDGNGRLFHATDARNKTTVYEYDAGGKLWRVTDPRGHYQVRNTYDTTSGRVTQQLDALGKQTTFAWDEARKQATVTNALGKSRVDVYNTKNVLVSATDELGNNVRYEHDKRLDVTAATDARANTQVLTYDERGNILTRSAPAPVSTVEAWHYNDQDEVVSYSDGKQNTTNYAYDPAGNLTTVTHADGTTTQYTLNGNGLPDSVQDQRGKTWTYTYDTQGNRTSVTSPLGNKTSYGYDTSGRLTSTVSPRGNVTGCNCANQYTTSFTYNENDQLLTATSPLNFVTSHSYDDNGNLASITNARNKTWTFTYDERDLRTKTTAPGAHDTLYSYDDLGRLQSTTTPLGNKTTYGYDDAGRRTTVVSPRGNVTGCNCTADYTTAYEYDKDGNLTRVVLPLGQDYEFGYDTANRRTSMTDARNNTTTYGYDDAGNLASQLNALGKTRSFYYDELNRLVRVRDENQNNHYTVYDAAGNVTERRSQLGFKTTYGYDDDGRLHTMVSPRGNEPGANPLDYTTSYGYDPDGHLLSTASPLGNTTSATYDRDGRQITATNARNKTTNLGYNAVGQLTSVTDPYLKVTSYDYDDLGRLTAITDQKSRLTTLGYDNDNRLAQALYPGNRKWTYGYDADGNRTQTIDANGNQPGANPYSGQVQTDGAQPYYRLGETSGSAFNSSVGTYPGSWFGSPTLGAAGALAADPNGAVALNGSSQYGTVADANQLDKTNNFSLEVWMKRSTNAALQAVAGKPLTTTTKSENYAFWFDSANKIRFEVGSGTKSATVTSAAALDANWHHVVGTFASGVLKLYVDGVYSATATASGFTSAGANASQLQVGRAGTTSYFGGSLDELALYGSVLTCGTSTVGQPCGSGQIADHYNKGSTTPPSNPALGTTTLGYDRNGRLSSIDYSDATPDVGFQYDANGNRSQMTDGEGTEASTYDELNRLKTVTRGGNSFSYDYDDASRLISRTLADNTVIGYGYDDDNRLTRATVGTDSVSYEYNADNALRTTTYPGGNGYLETRGYDRDGRLESLTNTKGASTLSSFTLIRDEDGNPTRVTALNNAVSWSERYTYDDLDRLTEACYQASPCTGGADPFIRWTYDEVGNRLTEQRPTGTTTYTYNTADQLMQRSGLGGTVAYTYDPNGNQLSENAKSFAYTLQNRLKSITNGGSTTSYFYDGDGKRLRRVDSTSTVKYLWDRNAGSNPVLALERDGSDQLIRRYSYGAGVFGFTNSSGSFYYHRDWLGSIADVTNANGGTEWAYSYEPFGLARTTTDVSGTAPTNPLGFGGEYEDSSAGLYHLRARDYDPTSGRFLNPDPVRGPPSDGYQSPYQYVNDQPTTMVDPSGMSFWGVIGGLYNTVTSAVQSFASTAYNLAYQVFAQPIVGCIHGSLLSCGETALMFVPGGRALGLTTRLAERSFASRMATLAVRMRAATVARFAREESGTLGLERTLTAKATRPLAAYGEKTWQGINEAAEAETALEAPSVGRSASSWATRSGGPLAPNSASAASRAAEDGTALARQLGTEGERLAGIDPAAKVRIPSATGTAAYRIPDALTETTLTEVKNVARLGYSNQLQDFEAYASSTRRSFDLIVRQNTVLTQELQGLENSGVINVIRSLPSR
jgi:RHS repeat-associated protein